MEDWKTTPQTDKIVIRNIKMNPTKTCWDFQRYWLATSFDVSDSTICRRFLENVQEARTPSKNQYLNGKRWEILSMGLKSNPLLEIGKRAFSVRIVIVLCMVKKKHCCYLKQVWTLKTWGIPTNYKSWNPLKQMFCVFSQQLVLKA